MLAYKAGYLKGQCPVAFMAAMLNSELSSSDAIAKYLAECRTNMGIQVLPPDINESDYFFTVAHVPAPAAANGPAAPIAAGAAGHRPADNAIRFGLGAVKGVGEGAIESVLGARRRVGRFRSLAHLVSEIDLRLANHKVLECLIKAGAFDGLGVHRAALAGLLDDVLEYGQRRRREREEGQANLFGLAALLAGGQPGGGAGGGPGGTSGAAGG